MVSIVKIDSATGLGLSTQLLPEDIFIAPDDHALSIDGQRLALVDGVVARVWDLRGASAFGGADGRQPVMIPNDPTMIGKGWADLAATKSAEHPFGLLKEARPETAAEKKAREKAEAEAEVAEEAAAKARAEAAEKDRLASLAVSDVQFGLACVGAGIITAEEAEAWVAAGVIPANLAAAIETLPPEQRTVARIKAAGEKTFERSSPFVAILGAALGMTSEQLDKLFITAAAI